MQTEFDPNRSNLDLKQQARAEIAVLLGRSVPISAKTLADALAEAEQIRLQQNIVIAQNSLWNWFNLLPLAEQETIGQFQNKYRLWTTVRFRHGQK